MPQSLSNSLNPQVFTVTSPEKSPELGELSDGMKVKIPEIFKDNISPQMQEFLSRFPLFEYEISKKRRLFQIELYQFITSRGYQISLLNIDQAEQYKEVVKRFIEK